MSQSVQEFYNQLQFPGTYTRDSLNPEYVVNPYLQVIDKEIQPGMRVLDAGCGTGLVANLMALRHPTSSWVGVDFADSVLWGTFFANQEQITNIRFLLQDLTQLNLDNKFDLIICQGVLHHIPDAQIAANNLVKHLAPNGKLVIGVYHPAGKILKKFMPVRYHNSMLKQDQEQHPYEKTYTPAQLLALFPGFCFDHSYPPISTCLWAKALWNSSNGGLVTYVLRSNP